MGNSTNKKQIEIILQRMQENPAIAAGYTKECKEMVAAFWKKLNLELNNAGPPVKSIMEWKKVWTDQKRYVKKKATENARQRELMGGGPCKIKMLSPTEEAIYEIVKMKESLEGMQNVHANTFELSTSLPFGNNIKSEPVDLNIENDFDDKFTDDNVPTYSASVKRKRDDVVEQINGPESIDDFSENISMAQIVQIVVKTQENMCNKICDLIELVNEEKLIKKNKLKEIERHNAVMEEYRKQEVESILEKNRKLIELEEKKLELMRKS